MKRRVLIVMLAVMTLGLGVSCSKPTYKIPKPGSMPSGARFTGVWYSNQFEHMYLRQTGDSVRGIYTYKYGGTLEGTINGNILEFKWLDPGNKEKAVRTQTGKGYLVLTNSDDGFVLKGRWGYDEDAGNGGLWSAEYVRDLESDDPKNLKEWREREIR